MTDTVNGSASKEPHGVVGDLRPPTDDPPELRALRARLSLDPANYEANHLYTLELIKLGRRPEVARHYADAAGRYPNDVWFARTAGIWLNSVDQCDDAVQQLARAIALSPEDAELYHQLAWASDKLDKPNKAALFAVRSFRLDQTNHHRALFAAHLLAKCERVSDAIDLLTIARNTIAPAAVVHQVLATMLNMAGRRDEAIEEVKQAISLNPRVADYHLLHSHILLETGQLSKGLAAIDAALEIDPSNHNLRRHKVSILLNEGRVTDAIMTTAILLQSAPEHDEYNACMQHVLSQRVSPTQNVSDVLARKRQKASGHIRREFNPTLREAAATQLRVIAALFLRELRTRYGDSRLGYLWVLVEMGIHIGFLAIVFQFTMKGKPPIGDSFFFFYFTGLIPYLLFVHTSEQVGHAIQRNKSMLQLPLVTNLNAIAACGLLELCTELVVAIVFIAGFLAAGIDAIPKSLGGAAGAILVCWLLGMGLGIINAIMNVFSHAWHQVFGGVQRLLYFCSGIFYVPGMMPEWLRDIFAWNPLLHCVDWFRSSFFQAYEPRWLSISYPIVCCLVLIAIGLGLEAALRRPLRQNT
ncbi:ABC transporter permease [Tardiphaga sp.]|jgi:ABC-type polysaccharide/polyol phosphate export permease/tetratricopeptide (TPR) repeat protein|uniref:ABC transporter permease n=1 Tax=Tardiphaga sp. TaxID=1926292 RepID=UPI0037DA0968